MGINTKIRRIMNYALIGSALAFSSLNCSKSITGPESFPAHSQTEFIADNSVRWIEYVPTNYNPLTREFLQGFSIWEDLKTLRQAHYEGLIVGNYSKDFPDIPRIAKEIGFKYVISSISDPKSREEIRLAKRNARFIDSYVVGQDGIKDGKYDYNDLENAIKDLRATTHKPVTTTERVADYNGSLLRIIDWVLLDADLEGKSDPRDLYALTTKVLNEYAEMQGKTSLPILIRNVEYPGKIQVFPPHADPFKYDLQNSFFRSLDRRLEFKQIDKPIFVYYEAFDQPWKGEENPSWPKDQVGLFTKDREQKIVSTPQIVFTMSTKAGVDSADTFHYYMLGQTANLEPEKYHTVFYAFDYDGGWKIQPNPENPVHDIMPNGRWKVLFDRRMSTSIGQRYQVFIVTPDFVPEPNTPPNVDGKKVISSAELFQIL